MKYVLLFLFIGVGVILYLEELPRYQDDIVDSGVVVASGCTTGSYKTRVTYNCSTDIEMSGGEVIRTVLKFGVLDGDKIVKMCGARLINPEYVCYYRRAFGVGEL